MIVCALKRQKLAFDYALTSEVPLLPDRVHLSYEARIAIIEGDEHVNVCFGETVPAGVLSSAYCNSD